MNRPLFTAFTESHKFWIVVFSFSFFSMHILSFAYFGLFFFFFPHFELHELCLYFGDQSFVSCFVFNYFLLFFALSFNLVHSFLCCANLLSIIKSLLFILVFFSPLFQEAGHRGPCFNFCHTLLYLCFPL